MLARVSSESRQQEMRAEVSSTVMGTGSQREPRYQAERLGMRVGVWQALHPNLDSLLVSEHMQALPQQLLLQMRGQCSN